jgi:hypothetical protein
MRVQCPYCNEWVEVDPLKMLNEDPRNIWNLVGSNQYCTKCSKPMRVILELTARKTIISSRKKRGRKSKSL